MLIQMKNEQAIETDGILAVTQNLDNSVNIRYGHSSILLHDTTVGEVLQKISEAKAASS